jgi:hypothetical protein
VITIGTFTRKTEPHQKWVSSAPPATGPMPTPSAETPAQTPMARARELFETERLRDVVVAADRETFHLFFGGVACGQEHDGHVVAVGPQPLHDREAVAVGEHDVEDHEIGAERGRGFQGVGAGARDLDCESLVAQRGRHEVGDVRLVVDNEDSCISHRFMLAPELVRRLCTP